MKYLPILFLLAGLALLILNHFTPGEGYGYVGGISLGIGASWAGINKARTGLWLTDSAGGH